MQLIFFQLLPFFGLIASGAIAVRSGMVSEQAIIHLTRFVFYFALSAMLFGFVSRLPIEAIFDFDYVLAYAMASVTLYIPVICIARMRGRSLSESAIKAQCAVIGNVGFLAIPVLVLIFGERSAPPVLLVLSVDLILFGSLVVALIAVGKDRKLSWTVVHNIIRGWLSNPMILAISSGLIWSVAGLPTPQPMTAFLTMAGAAATPCALFAIGGSLVSRRAEQLSVALWLSLCKLVLHPLIVAIFALVIFRIESFAAGIMIIAAAMPVAGNIYILAQHYGVVPQRVSASIFVSTMLSIITLMLAIRLCRPLTSIA